LLLAPRFLILFASLQNIAEEKKIMSLLSELNLPQREAVTHESGPCLVLAGAGSGKTRVITYRIAHLVNEGKAKPWEILAVTFTNKAAAEMRERVKELLPGVMESPFVSTFHSFGLYLLRRNIKKLGFPQRFSIYDTDDQVAVLRRILKEMEFDGETPKSIQSKISFAKNSKFGPEEHLGRDVDSDILDIYRAYQKRLKSAGAVDFDDLLLLTNDLLETDADLLKQLQNRYKYILVDEYQDTNQPQYKLIKMLAGDSGNVVCVGDDDQSIYKWRGADIANILNFGDDFEGTKIVKLEQNYRSTQNILDAANGIVESLSGRHPKKLWTDQGKGLPITYFLADDDSSEASFVVREISSAMRTRKPTDFAILYRTNSQSRQFEEALARHRIPFQIVGGTRFYNRREVKDILAYLQFAINPGDLVAMRRVINTPTRGIGDVTVARLLEVCTKHDMTPWEVLNDGMHFMAVTPRAKGLLAVFRELMQGIQDMIAEERPASEIIDQIIKDSDYISMLMKEGADEAANRMDNLKELIGSARAFEATTEEENPITAYLDQVSLVADIDEFDNGAPKVTLMTLHSAKGLEFPVVFLAGMEDGLLPHGRSIDDPEQMEEERRLCYVGITRAKESLYLTAARVRRSYEGMVACYQSRFLRDIPPHVLDERGADLLHKKSRKKPQFGSNIDNIGQFFKDRDIDVDLSKLEKSGSGGSSGQFKKGDAVFMEKFGPGRVMMVEGSGDSMKYVVYFSKLGKRKKLLARVAKLHKA
jgi:DNA helicase-2/ATP-dependent DNA helicase PcrA